MSDLPKLTDQTRLTKNRARALRMGADLFLHQAAADEIKERLNEVNRRFTRPAVVSDFAGFWGAQFPGVPVIPARDLLTFEPQAHDLVIHAMALHWANDPVGQLIQCRRALVRDGLLLVVLPGGQTLHELRSALAEAEARLSGGLSPRVLPMAEIRDLGGLLGRAGLALPVADALRLKASYRDLPHLAHDLRAMGEGNALAARGAPGTRALFDLAGKIYAASFPAEGGRIAATFELNFLTGWAPDESQPKPLKPGSALTRLADALNADEGPKT